MLISDEQHTSLSTDTTTVFGLRQPELRFVRKQKHYFQWFYREKSSSFKFKSPTVLTDMDNCLQQDLKKSMWIDGFGHRVFLRLPALNKVIKYLEQTTNQNFYSDDNDQSLNECVQNRESPKQKTIYFFQYLQRYYNQYGTEGSNNIRNPAIWADVKKAYFGPALSGEHSKIPVVWFNNVKPTMMNRWLLHILYSMGEFDNEINILSCRNLQEAFQKAKLLSLNSNLWKDDIERILKDYVLEQLVFLPGGTKTFDLFLVSGYVSLMQGLIGEYVENNVLPPALISSIRMETDQTVKKFMINSRSNLINITLNQLTKKGFKHLPSKDDLQNATKEHSLQWDIEFDGSSEMQSEKSKL
jgi:hypothetical protein